MIHKPKQDTAAEVESVVADDNKQTPPAKKRKKKLLVTLGIVVVVIGIAGVGMFVWHNQPSFCSTLCHPVMSPYVESWEEGDSLAHAHAKANTACLDCHEATIQDQIHELTVYAEGSYRTPLAPRDFGDEFCERCHDRSEITGVQYPVDYGSVPEDLLQKLEEGGFDIKDPAHQNINPHERGIGTNPDNPHVEGAPLQECSSCHSIHDDKGTSLKSCYTCHHTKTFASCDTCHS